MSPSHSQRCESRPALHPLCGVPTPCHRQPRQQWLWASRALSRVAELTSEAGPSFMSETSLAAASGAPPRALLTPPTETRYSITASCSCLVADWRWVMAVSSAVPLEIHEGGFA